MLVYKRMHSSLTSAATTAFKPSALIDFADPPGDIARRPGAMRHWQRRYCRLGGKTRFDLLENLVGRALALHEGRVIESVNSLRGWMPAKWTAST